MKANDMTIETVPHADEWPERPPIHYIPNESAPRSIPAHSLRTRAYLRCLRAAEMAAWELTGGDYLLSHCATNVRRTLCC
jgi:hypothetical protein